MTRAKRETGKPYYPKRRKVRLSPADEVKYLDLNYQAVIASAADLTLAMADPAAGVVGCLSAPSQGDGPDQRDGKQIYIRSIQIKGLVQQGPFLTAASPPGPLRVMIALVLDQQTNQTQCLSNNIYSNPGATTAGTVVPLRNIFFNKRFKIIRTLEIDISADSLSHFSAGSYAWNGTTATFDMYVKFKEPIVVNFSVGTAANVNQVIDNSLHLVAFSNSAVPALTLTYNGRMRFVG